VDSVETDGAAQQQIEALAAEALAAYAELRVVLETAQGADGHTIGRTRTARFECTLSASAGWRLPDL
jgi:hypothetical protein